MPVKSTPRSIRREYRQKMYADGVLYSDQTYDGSIYSWIDTVDKDGPLLDFRQRIRNGDNATTYLSGEEFIVECEPGYFYRKYKRDIPSDALPNEYEDSVSGKYLFIAPISGTSDLSINTAKNQALARFYSNLNSIDTKFKGMVFAGELRESLKMIRHPASALRKGFSYYLNHIKKYGRLKRAHRLSAVRATWLEYSFGWLPLINDLDSAITAFYTSDVAHPIFEMARGRGMVEDYSPFFNFEVTPITNVVLEVEMVQRMSTIVSLYGIHHSEGRGVENLHHYGFRPSEFVPTLWELIPYSFVVDYFTNIGKILESWSYRWIGPRFLSQTVITELEHKFERLQPRVEKIDGFSDVTVTIRPGSARSAHKNVTRIPSVPLSLPSLELKVPGRWTQWTNLVALSAQLKSTRAILGQK